MEKIMICELSPADGRKSFYGKAKIYKDGENLHLISYNTCVLSYNFMKNELIRDWSGYSVTTMRHVNAFMKFLGFGYRYGGKAWWDSLPVGVPMSI